MSGVRSKAERSLLIGAASTALLAVYGAVLLI